MEDNSSLASAPTRLTFNTCSVEVESKADHVEVRLAGDIDMADADEVADVLVRAAEARKPMVRVRLSDLRFADSSAVRAILIGANAAGERGVAYELVDPRGVVRRLLEVSGLAMALTVVDESPDENGSASR